MYTLDSALEPLLFFVVVKHASAPIFNAYLPVIVCLPRQVWFCHLPYLPSGGQGKVKPQRGQSLGWSLVEILYTAIIYVECYISAMAVFCEITLSASCNTCVLPCHVRRDWSLLVLYFLAYWSHMKSILYRLLQLCTKRLY